MSIKYTGSTGLKSLLSTIKAAIANKADKTVATTSANGLMSSTDKSKLDGITAGANKYSLPTATASVLGGVKIGSNINISSGQISVENMRRGFYAVCSTEAATEAKTVTATNFTVTAGSIIAVKFTYAVPANATLNVNSTAAYEIYYNGSAIVADVIAAGVTATLIYGSDSIFHVLAIDKMSKVVQELSASTEDVPSCAAVKSAILDYTVVSTF